MINHSCVANVESTNIVMMKSSSTAFVAKRIKKGEELFVSYLGAPAERLPKQERQNHLTAWLPGRLQVYEV